MPIWEIFLWGLLGGIGAEVVVFFGIRHQNPLEFPYWVKSKAYYIIAVIMALIGAFITIAYARSGTNLNPILAIQIGASAPLILRKARDAASEPSTPPNLSAID